MLKIKPDDGYGLKGITVNGYPIDIEKALEDRALEYDSVAGVYTHTTHGIYQAWKVTVDLEKQHQFIFEDQNGAQISSGSASPSLTAERSLRQSLQKCRE